MRDKTWGILIPLFIILILLIIFGVKRVDKNSSPEEPRLNNTANDACYACRQFVRNNLKAPSTADFQLCDEASSIYQRERVFTVNSYVDAQNAFGAKLRYDFTCTAEYIPSRDGWILVDLKFEE